MFLMPSACRSTGSCTQKRSVELSPLPMFFRPNNLFLAASRMGKISAYWVAAVFALLILVLIIALIVTQGTKLCKEGGASRAKISLVHATDPDEQRIIQILQDGYLRPGEGRRLSGGETGAQKFTFANISVPGYRIRPIGAGLVLDPGLLRAGKFYFNPKGWSGGPSDDVYTVDGRRVKSLSRTLGMLMRKVKGRAGPRDSALTHEVFFPQSVPLKRYLRAVDVDDPEKYPELDKYLDSHYPGVRLVTTSGY